MAAGKSWPDRRGTAAERPAPRAEAETAVEAAVFQRVLSRRGAAGDVPAQAGRSLCVTGRGMRGRCSLGP